MTSHRIGATDGKSMTDAPVVPQPKTAKDAFKKSLNRLAIFTYPETTRISLGITALAVNSITNLRFPWIMGRAIDLVSVAEAGNGTCTDEQYTFIVTAIGVFFVGSVASWIRVYCLGTATDRVTFRIRKHLYNRYPIRPTLFASSSHILKIIIEILSKYSYSDVN